MRAHYLLAICICTATAYQAVTHRPAANSAALQSSAARSSVVLDREDQVDQQSSGARAFFERSLEPEPEREPGAAGRFGESRSGTASYDVRDTAGGYWEPMSLPPDRLRASDLNELLHPDYMDRAKFSVSPMQAYGALFKGETVLSGMLELNKRSWTMVANEHNYEPPDDEEVGRAMLVRPERAIQQIFRWTDDWGETQRLAFERWEAHTSIFRDFSFEAAPGAVHWLTILEQYQVPCVVSTQLGKEEADHVLEMAGLRNLFQEVVTAEDGCETLEQSYLVSCLKIKRPPSRCVVFENEPQGVVAAHDAMTKVVAIIGNHPGYAFRHADMRIGSLEELSLMSLREVFRDEGPR